MYSYYRLVIIIVACLWRSLAWMTPLLRCCLLLQSHIRFSTGSVALDVVSNLARVFGLILPRFYSNNTSNICYLLSTCLGDYLFPLLFRALGRPGVVVSYIPPTAILVALADSAIGAPVVLCCPYCLPRLLL